MFGRQPKLAIDALLGLNFDDSKAKSRNEYVHKLRDRLSFAYQKAKQIAEETAKVNNRQYDKKAKSSVLQPGDIVLAKNVIIRGKNKIANKWESEPYVVVSKPNENIPVYSIKKQNGRSRKVRTVHRNLLLPLKPTLRGDEEMIPKYVIPARRNRITNTDNPDDTISTRPKPQVRRPQWQRSDQWQMNQ